jgi:hypothetical protein
MSWKEFFKPSLNKLFLFLIISNYAILSILFLFRPEADNSFLDIFDTLAIFLSLPFFFAKNNVGYFGLNLIFYMLLTLFYWYLISCFVVWVYERLKKKK